jgi:hypothetical protein
LCDPTSTTSSSTCKDIDLHSLGTKISIVFNKVPGSGFILHSVPNQVGPIKQQSIWFSQLNFQVDGIDGREQTQELLLLNKHFWIYGMLLVGSNT